MGYLEDIKNWVIEHKKLVIIVLVIIALLVILYQYKEKNEYLNTFYSYVWPFGYNGYYNSYYVSPMIPSVSTSGYESLPQLYL